MASKSKCYRLLTIFGTLILLTILSGCQSADLKTDIFHADKSLRESIIAKEISANNDQSLSGATLKTPATTPKLELFDHTNIDWIFGAIASSNPTNLQLLLQSINNKNSYRTVVLLAPTTHKTATHNVFTYQKPGVLSSKNIKFDEETIQSLINANIIESLGEIGENSYWNSGVLDIVGDNFPESKLILISANSELSANQKQILAYGIMSHLPRNSIFIALAEFTQLPEDQNPLITRFRQDYISEVLNTVDTSHFDELPIESPVILEVMGHYIRYKQAKNPTILKTGEDGYQVLFKKENPNANSAPNSQSTAIKPESTVYMVAFGDIMLGRYVRHLMDANGLDYPFQDMDESYLKVNDVLLANLEGPITEKSVRTVTGMNFGFFPDTAPLLKKYHFDILSQANNHTFDKTSAAFTESFKNIREQGIIPFGNPNVITEDSVGYMHIRGHMFAFLGLEEVNTAIDDEAAVQKVKDLSALGYKVIVVPHWGIEYTHKPNTRQKELARKLIDAGAYMIIAHHPHVVQTIENYNGHPIIYSLGNAIFDQYWSAPTQEGLSVALKMTNNSVEIYLLPIKLPKSQFRLMTETERAEFLNRFITWGDYSEEEKKGIIEGKMVFEW